MENEKNEKRGENETDEMKNKNLKESTTDISTSVKSPPAKNVSKAVSTSTISTSTSAKEYHHPHPQSRQSPPQHQHCPQQRQFQAPQFT